MRIYNYIVIWSTIGKFCFIAAQVEDKF